jgi:hypothetical protein
MMKSMQCDRCKATFKADTFQDWFNQMLPHYKETHPEVMDSNKSKEEGQKWMAEAKARFESI